MSFPTANYQALTLANAIASGWSLTGSLAPSSSFNPSITTDPVFFYAHPDFGADVIATKCVRVRKISTIENVIEHPLFDEVRDSYQIDCYYSLEGVEKVMWDNAESNVEAMENEVLRILKTLYDPQSGTGTFFTIDRHWENKDQPSIENPEYLIRGISITLIKLRSRITTGFIGYGGQLLFDVTNSQGVSLPGSNYLYTEYYNYKVTEGFQQIQRRVTGNPRGKGIPLNYRGKFGGTFSVQLFAKVADIGVTSTNLLNNIYQLLSNSQVADIFMINQVKDTEGSPKTLTTSTRLKVISFDRQHDLEHLVTINLQGMVIQPSSSTVA